MDSVTSFASTHTSFRLIDQVNRLRASMAESGVPLTDMSRAGALETMIGADALDEVGQDAARPVTIARLESPWIESRPVTVAAPGVSRFRYFLDGSQKTVPVCRIGLLPIGSCAFSCGDPRTGRVRYRRYPARFAARSPGLDCPADHQ